MRSSAARATTAQTAFRLSRYRRREWMLGRRAVPDRQHRRPRHRREAASIAVVRVKIADDEASAVEIYDQRLRASRARPIDANGEDCVGRRQRMIFDRRNIGPFCAASLRLTKSAPSLGDAQNAQRRSRLARRDVGAKQGVQRLRELRQAGRNRSTWSYGQKIRQLRNCT